MSREEQAFAAWHEAHTSLRTYLETWCGADDARQIASSACAVWVQSAADGNDRYVAPYAHLYLDAAGFLGGLSLKHEVPSPELAEAAIPLHTTLLPYQLSKIYVDIWKAAQLLSWDRKTIHRAARGLSLIWPVSDSGWAPLGVHELGNLVPPLARRAVETLEHHRCVDCDVCAEAAVRWEDADKATEQWFTQMRLAREE